MKLTFEQAEEFVAGNSEYFWDGYVIKRFKKDSLAEYNPLGRRRGDDWGYITEYYVDHNGEWTIL